jgi:late competence protein required for DNA uptake (superfamily II DNA/RNA helicase)
MRITCERCGKELEVEPFNIPISGVICDGCVEKERQKMIEEDCNKQLEQENHQC